MRKLLPVLLLCISILSSCELFTEEVPAGKFRFVAYANTYDNRDKVKTLVSCENDALNLDKAFSLLCEKYEVPYEFIQISDEVNYQGYESAIQAFADDVTPYDITVFYFSCHGYSATGDSKLGYGAQVSESSYIAIIENTAAKKNVQIDYGEGGDLYACSDFLALISPINGIKIVISDFCYGGGLIQSDGMSIVPGAYKSSLDVFDLLTQYEVNVSSSVFCITASRYNEKCYVAPNGLSYFTGSLLSGLGFDVSSQSLSGFIPCELNGKVSLGSIFQYVVKNDGKNEQNPCISGGSQDIVIFKR